MNNKLLIAGFLVLVLAGFCLAQQEEQAKPGVTPDNVFYGLDRAMERIQLALTRNEVNKAELHLRYAAERLAELDAMVQKNKTKYYNNLAREQEQEITRAQEELQKATALGKNTTLLAEHVANMTSKHILVLQKVWENAPEQAKDSIMHAINVSQHGYNQAVESILKEKPVNATKGKPEGGEAEPEDSSTAGMPDILQQEGAGQASGGGAAGQETVQGKGNLVIKITDKPSSLNITKLELTISSVKVHTSSQAVEGTECVDTSYLVVECENETEAKENCTEYNTTQEVCANETKINTTCTEAECVNGTFVEAECVNGTLIPEECTNTTYVELACENETETEENCTEYNTTQEVCANVTKTNTTCTNVTGGGTAGWAVVLSQSKTFDLMDLKEQGIKAFLGNTTLGAGKYTQIRLMISSANLEISGVKQALKTPSNTLKLIKPFTVSSGKTTTLTLDFDAEASVHQAGSQYIMKPTIKVIQE